MSSQQQLGGRGRPPEVEGGGAVHEEVVPRDGGNEDVPAQAPVKERAGDAEDRTEKATYTREIFINKDDKRTAMNQSFITVPFVTAAKAAR